MADVTLNHSGARSTTKPRISALTNLKATADVTLSHSSAPVTHAMSQYITQSLIQYVTLRTYVSSSTLRVRFFKKIQGWILNPNESENGFCVSLLNRSFGSWHVKRTEDSTSRVDSSVPLRHQEILD